MSVSKAMKYISPCLYWSKSVWTGWVGCWTLSFTMHTATSIDNIRITDLVHPDYETVTIRDSGYF